MAEPRTIAIITGSRAEYGLLMSVMKAIAANSQLDLRIIVTGTHLLPPNETWKEIAADFPVAAKVSMQSTSDTGRVADAKSLGRGVAGFAQEFAANPPDIVLVLGDRIEAFAAAAAAAVSGIRVAHMHGGDRAEGIADEALRHAITKLAHIHLPATVTSAMRIVAMGEDPRRVHVVGSPAIDGLRDIPPLRDQDFTSLGSPRIIVLLHPVGDADDLEHSRATELLRVVLCAASALVLHPNHDPGREGIMRALAESGMKHVSHLPREKFIGLLRRASVLIGNSSAGLIECAAMPIRCINLGSRQSGREKPANVIDIPNWDYQTIESSLNDALASPQKPVEHPYGDGTAGVKTAELLATLDFEQHPLRKINSY